MNPFKTQQGMSLVSVLVAIALTGVLATILMNLSDQQNKQQQKAMVDGDLTEIMGHFRSILTNAESCNATLMNKKKGQKITRLLLSDNATTEPFAKVDTKQPFRGSKILLTGMKILTDDEVKKMNVDGLVPQPGIVVLRASFQRINNPIGAKDINKHFEIRVLYGQENKEDDPLSPTGVVAACKKKYGSEAFIKNLDTGERAVPEEAGTFTTGEGYFGMCVFADESNPNSAIIQCITAR